VWLGRGEELGHEELGYLGEKDMQGGEIKYLQLERV